MAQHGAWPTFPLSDRQAGGRVVRASALARLCGAGLLLAGCRVGPRYVAPQPEFPVGYRSAEAGAGVAAVATDWWKGFGSPDLDALMADAAADGFDVRAAIA